MVGFQHKKIKFKIMIQKEDKKEKKYKEKLSKKDIGGELPNDDDEKIGGELPKDDDE